MRGRRSGGGRGGVRARAHPRRRSPLSPWASRDAPEAAPGPGRRGGRVRGAAACAASSSTPPSAARQIIRHDDAAAVKVENLMLTCREKHNGIAPPPGTPPRATDAHPPPSRHAFGPAHPSSRAPRVRASSGPLRSRRRPTRDRGNDEHVASSNQQRRRALVLDDAQGVLRQPREVPHRVRVVRGRGARPPDRRALRRPDDVRRLRARRPRSPRVCVRPGAPPHRLDAPDKLSSRASRVAASFFFCFRSHPPTPLPRRDIPPQTFARTACATPGTRTAARETSRRRTSRTSARSCDAPSLRRRKKTREKTDENKARNRFEEDII